MLGFDTLQLDGNLFAGDDVGTFELSERGSLALRKCAHRGRYPQNSHSQSYVRCGTCCQHEDPRHTEVDVSRELFNTEEMDRDDETTVHMSTSGAG